MGRMAISALAILAAAQATAAGAATVGLTLIPNAWILENYPGNQVKVWTNGTTGACARLNLNSSWTTDDRSRFWSTVMTGKVAQKNIFVYYDDTSCELFSFGRPGA